MKNKTYRKIVYRNLDARYNHYYRLKRKTSQKSKTEKIILLLMLNALIYTAVIGWANQSRTIEIYTRAEASSVEDNTDICDLDVVFCENEPKKETVPAYPIQAWGTTYNAEVGQTDADPFTMANGKRVNESAVASNCYPLGTHIDVEGMGVFTVEDRMNSRYTADCGTDKERIDFFKWSRQDNFAKFVKFRLL